MSRIGRNPVLIPSGVNILLGESEITVKGQGGVLGLLQNPLVRVIQSSNSLIFEPTNPTHQSNAMTGTMRQLTYNMVQGVTRGFEKKLSLMGVGYKAQVQNNRLVLTVGHSHPVYKEMPKGVKVECSSPTEILIKGMDRQAIGQIAAEIRAVRPPEPYKGKGIRYSNETVKIKETKKK